MSESFIYSAGLHNVGSYQVSGMPFAISGSTGGTTVKISFPYVTKWVQIQNYDGTHALSIGFSNNGVNNANHFSLDKKTTTPVYDLKITELYLRGETLANDVDYHVIAGLTNIPVERINNSAVSPSGSNWSGSYSPGVG
jgi:hypothetical protein